MSAQAITWKQITAWQMERQGLVHRANKADWQSVVKRVCGLPMQDRSAIALAIWARAEEMTPAAIEAALAEGDVLQQHIAMRGHNHLMHTGDWPAYRVAWYESNPHLPAPADKEPVRDGMSFDHAVKTVVRRYLGTYGPATLEQFARWWGTDAAKAKRMFRLLDIELAQVTVEGWSGWMLRDQLDAIRAAKLDGRFVRLLPAGDPYTVSMQLRSRSVLDDRFNPLVYRADGMIAPVVILDGQIAGVWRSEQKKSQLEVNVDWFERAQGTEPSTRTALEDEVLRMAYFYETEIVLR